MSWGDPFGWVLVLGGLGGWVACSVPVALVVGKLLGRDQ